MDRKNEIFRYKEGLIKDFNKDSLYYCIVL